MRKRFSAGWGLVIALIITMFPLAGGSVLAAQNGLNDDRYESPQFGYTVTWDDNWEARPRDVISNSGGYDTLTLRGDDGTHWVQGQGDRTSAAEAVEHRIGIEGSEGDVVAADLGADVPVAEMLVGRNTVLIEAHTLESNDTVVVAVLSAREQDFDDALASVHEQILFNGDQILRGVEPEAGTEGEGTLVPADEASADPTGEVPEEAALPEVDDESTEEGVPVDMGSAINGSTYTSPPYGYSVEWSEDTWDVVGMMDDETSDSLQLVSDTGALTIWSWDVYGDPVSCLDAESGHYEFDDPAIGDWEPALDVDGKLLRAEADDYAWGVFTLTYSDPGNGDAESVDLVDYIECRTIPETDAMLIILGSATPDQYNDHLDSVLDVADTITFGQGTVSSPAGPDEDESGLDGSLFTSPSFGFSIEVPAQWRVVNEVIARDNEVLVLSNGTSDVMIRATDDYADDLAGCVDFAAEESGYELDLDENASGQPFRGDDRNGAYGNFVYEDEDGEKQAYFISCQFIEDGTSVLILTQDLAYEDISSERTFRSDLQDAIQLP